MSFSGLVFIAVLALIVFGPKKFLEIAKRAGTLAGELKRAASRIQSDLERELQNDVHPTNPGATLANPEAAPCDGAPNSTTQNVVAV